jgi:YbgC/YbaW family acyl-CoA thioester hydrolase
MTGLLTVPREFQLKRRVQFHETDTVGLVHFSWFFKYMEEAEPALWRAAGLSIHPAGSEIGWPRVSTSFEFHSPLRFEDEFEIVIRIEAIGRRTIRYSCAITRGGVSIATGALTIACVRKAEDGPLASIDIPPDIAARFAGSPD